MPGGKSSLKKSKENKWIKAMDLLKHSRLVGVKPELNKQRETREIMEVLNTTTYRTKYKTQKLRANSLARAGGLMDKTKYFFLKGYPNSAFDKIKVISDPSASASDSVVFLLVKGRQQFVMKLTFVSSKNALEYNAPDTEARFYKIMESLVKYKITPHVFTLTDCLWESIDRKTINPSFDTYLRKYNTNKTHVYPILTETGNADSELLTLKVLLERIYNKYDYKNSVQESEASWIITNIIFQVMYTIQCFIRIGFKHTDLHFGNIFVLVRPENVLKDASKVTAFKRKYTYNLEDGRAKSVLLENIGIDVRIFDFDRSVKHKNNFRYYPEALKSRFLRSLYQLGHNAAVNPYQDTYKVLCHLYFSRHVPKKIKDLVYDYFIQPSALLDATIWDKKKIFIDPLINGYRYYLLRKTLPDGVMQSNLVILNDISKLMTWKDTSNKSVLESYTTENIVESEKERVLKTINSRKAAKYKERLAKTYDTAIKARDAAATKSRMPPGFSPSPIKQKPVVAPKPRTSPSKATDKHIITKWSLKRIDPKEINNNIKGLVCNDSLSRRSTQKTSIKDKNGKVKRGKLIDQEAKNCMLPFKNMISQGRGKSKKAKIELTCVKDDFGAWCATERQSDCTPKKVAYCV
jgi:hypothetical protein